MPTYDYHCDACGHELEVFQSMRDPHLTECPSCKQSTLKRKIGLGAGIIFKGGGFYETDFKDKKGSSEGASSTSGGGDTAEKSKETKAAPKAETPVASASTSTPTSD